MMFHHWRSNAFLALLLTTNNAAQASSELPVTSKKSQQQQLQRRDQNVYNFQYNYDFGAYENDNGDFLYDLSEYSIRFGKCQYAKMYDDEIAENDEFESVLAVKQFVVYRLCPTSNCGECHSNYGEYVAEVEDYLQALVQGQQQDVENMCEKCEDACDEDGDEYDADYDCEECTDVCNKYDELEENGYVDASEYIECQKFDYEKDDDDDGDEEFELYIGPRCTRDGTRIKIDLFTDKNCWTPYTDQDAEDLLGLKFSYHVLESTYSDSDCVSCMEPQDEEDQNDDDAEDFDTVNEMCETIYALSAKCESTHGIENGFVQQNLEEEDYENQVANEYDVCTFIDSLVFNSYTEEGEFAVNDERNIQIIRKHTSLQKMVLVGLAFSVVGLFSYAAKLHRDITQLVPMGDGIQKPLAMGDGISATAQI